MINSHPESRARLDAFSGKLLLYSGLEDSNAGISAIPVRVRKTYPNHGVYRIIKVYGI